MILKKKSTVCNEIEDFIGLLYLDLYVLGDDALLVRGLSCKPNIYVS